MLTIVGDVIEYDGKPFAIITAPLSGWRMDAIDFVSSFEDEINSRVEDELRINRLDYKQYAKDIVDQVANDLEIEEHIVTALKSEIDGAGWKE